MKIMAFGTFDRFHAGHESYLKQAKVLGDTLIVVIALDKTVKRIKGKLPDHNQKQRLNNVKHSQLADKVILGNTDDKYAVVKKYKPSIIALGYDQFTFTFRLEKFLIDNKMDTKVMRMKPYKPNVYKTSILKNAVIQYSPSKC